MIFVVLVLKFCILLYNVVVFVVDVNVFCVLCFYGVLNFKFVGCVGIIFNGKFDFVFSVRVWYCYIFEVE